MKRNLSHILISNTWFNKFHLLKQDSYNSFLLNYSLNGYLRTILIRLVELVAAQKDVGSNKNILGVIFFLNLENTFHNKLI